MFIRFNERELRNFVIQIDDTPLNYRQEYLDVREEVWQKALVQNPKYWNGKVYDLREIDSTSKQLILKLRISEFKDSLARERLTDKYILENFGRNCLQTPAVVHLLTFDADRNLIAGRRSKNVFKEQNKLALIGGSLSPDEVKFHNFDNVKEQLIKEFGEEAGFDVHKEDLYLYGLSYYKSVYAFIFVLNKSLEIEDFKQSDNFEFDEFVTLDLSELNQRDDLDEVFQDIKDEVIKDFS